MRKLFGMLIAALLVIALPIASAVTETETGREVQKPGTGTEQPEVRDATQGTDAEDNTPTSVMQNESRTGQGMSENESRTDKGMPESVGELRERMQKRAQQLRDNASAMGERMRNQNQVRATIESLHMMEDHVGGYGEQVSEAAREMNNSFERAYQAEENIKRRGGLARFFVGGDEKAAEEIEQSVNQTQDKIRELKQVREDCDCPDDVKLMLEEQIQNLEGEENRLRGLANQEQKKSGLFGWLLG